MQPVSESRRERLALLCALDRARLRLALKPAPLVPAYASAAITIPNLDLLLALVRCLPGRIGRWARRAGMISDLFRVLAR